MSRRRVQSTEFRKTYARLTEPVVVVVFGRPIGLWFPVSGNITEDDLDKADTVQPNVGEGEDEAAG